ncbi:MAG TPA: amidohydrolase family protein [Xanthomonadaceae bacterium]|nr:amidohydrolase family protein [Xanthomonadaceae bacterium]
MLVACALLAAAVAAAAAADRPPLAIRAVTVVDVVAGAHVGPRTVLVVDGRIAAVGARDEVQVPAGAVVIDGAGRYLIPGLVDMHVHLFNNHSGRPHNDWAFPLYVAHGVTGVREMWVQPGSMDVVAGWRRQVEEGALVAPRVLAAGSRVQEAAPHDARRAVRELARAGVDFVKVFSRIPPQGWRAALAEAARRGLPVAGHVPAQVRLLDAAEAGQRSNEHLTQVHEACTSIQDELLAERAGLDPERLGTRMQAQETRVLAAFDALQCRTRARRLAATGQAQVPTLVMARMELALLDPAHATDPRLNLLREDERARWQRILGQLGPVDAALARQRWEVTRRIVGILHRAGVPLLAGTDSPMPLVYPGYALHEELALLVESGLTPVEALRAATIGPMRWLGLEAEAGSIEAGKRADLVVLDADPLADIAHTRAIHAVVLAGRLHDRGALDAMLPMQAADERPAH